MDQLMAEDLSMTTSMFLKQLSIQLNRWSEADLDDDSIKQQFSEEIKEHPHIQGFALYQEGNIQEAIGNIEKKRFVIAKASAHGE